MKNKGDWLLLLAAAIGGGGFISLKYLLDWGYSPYHIIFGRFLVAACGMGLFYFRQIPQITKREWKAGGVLGAMLAAMFLLLTMGVWYICMPWKARLPVWSSMPFPRDGKRN